MSTIKPKMKESEFWASVRSGFLKIIGMHLSRIENMAGDGMPDISAAYKGVEVWIELKMFHGNRIQLRDAQRIWINARTKVGGKVVILARKDKKIYLIDAMKAMAAPYQHIPDKKSFTIHKDDLTVIFEDTVPVDWQALTDKIFGVTSGNES